MSDDKYKAACVEYAAAQRALKAISKEIGEHFANCQEAIQAKWEAENPHADPWKAPAPWQKSPHLQDAYAMTVNMYDGTYYMNHDDDVEGFLAETCEHCLKAHLALQERKPARARFGVAKRRISVMGSAK